MDIHSRWAIKEKLPNTTKEKIFILLESLGFDIYPDLRQHDEVVCEKFPYIYRSIGEDMIHACKDTCKQDHDGAPLKWISLKEFMVLLNKAVKNEHRQQLVSKEETK